MGAGADKLHGNERDTAIKLVDNACGKVRGNMKAWWFLATSNKAARGDCSGGTARLAEIVSVCGPSRTGASGVQRHKAALGLQEARCVKSVSILLLDFHLQMRHTFLSRSYRCSEVLQRLEPSGRRGLEAPSLGSEVKQFEEA